MARVPYSGVPEIAATSQGTPMLHAQVPAAAFGANVADAMGNLGGAVSKAGDELFQRALALQQIANHDESTQADMDYMIQAGKLSAEYNAKQGAEKVQAYDAYAKNLRELREKIGGALSNPMSRRMYESSSRRTMAYAVSSGASAAATAFRQYTTNNAEAQTALDANAVSENPNDDAMFQDKLKRTQDNTRFLAAEKGFKEGDAATKAMLKDAESRLRRERIVGLSRSQPETAQDVFKTDSKFMTEADRQKAEQAVTVARHNTVSRLIAGRVNEDLYKQPDPKLPEKTLDERIKEGRTIAERDYPDDPLMQEYVSTAIRNGYSNYKRDLADAEYRNIQTLQEALQNNIGGKLPTSLDELFMSDKARKAYLDLPASKRTSIRHALEVNAKDDVAETEKSYALYHRYLGMSQSDDLGTRLEFMNKVFPAEGELPRKRRDQLVKVQQQMRKGFEQDPHVMQGMRILTDAGIAPRMDQDKEGALQFRGALQEALYGLQEQKQVPKTLEDWKKLGVTLTQKVPGSGWFGTNVGAQRIFEIDVPAEVAKHFAERGYTPEQIQREYAKARFIQQWNLLYGKAK